MTTLGEKFRRAAHRMLERLEPELIDFAEAPDDLPDDVGWESVAFFLQKARQARELNPTLPEVPPVPAAATWRVDLELLCGWWRSAVDAASQPSAPDILIDEDRRRRVDSIELGPLEVKAMQKLKDTYPRSISELELMRAIDRRLRRTRNVRTLLLKEGLAELPPGYKRNGCLISADGQLWLELKTGNKMPVNCR